MFKLRALVILVIGAMFCIGTSLQAYAYSGQKYAKQAKISLAQARKIAEKEIPGGRIVSQELEKEKGGSGLRYSFDIKSKGQAREVGVDAKTSKVLENSLENDED